MPVLSHNTSVSGYDSLRAIPVSGTVYVQITDANGTIVGNTKCNTKGEWLQTFDLEDGVYSVKFTGNFRPIGKDKNARYAAKVRSQSVSVTLITPEKPIKFNDIVEVVGGEPKKDSILISKGSNWTPSPILSTVLDLQNNQSVDGIKTFVKTPFFQQGVRISLDDVISFGTSDFSAANISFSYETGFKFSSGNTSWFLTDFATKLSDLSDVSQSELTAGNVFWSDGISWQGTNPDQANLVTLNSDQLIVGKKTFQQPLSFPVSSSIYEDGNILKIKDSTGEYSLSQLASNTLSGLSDVSSDPVSNGNILVYSNNVWSSIAPANANLVTIDQSQIISSKKTFMAGMIVNTSISGNIIDTSLYGYTSSHIPTSGAVIDYLSSSFLKLDATNGPIEGDLIIDGSLLVDGNVDVTGSLELGTLIVSQILGTEESGGTCELSIPCRVRMGGSTIIVEDQSISFDDSLCQIYRSGNDLSFKDANIGTLTLSDMTKPKLVYINDSTGWVSGFDIHVSDGTHWNVDKSIIKEMIFETDALDWDLYLLQKDTGHAANDATITERQIISGASGKKHIVLDLYFEDEDASQEVHFYYVDNDAGAENLTKITVLGIEAR